MLHVYCFLKEELPCDDPHGTTTPTVPITTIITSELQMLENSKSLSNSLIETNKNTIAQGEMYYSSTSKQVGSHSMQKTSKTRPIQNKVIKITLKHI